MKDIILQEPVCILTGDEFLPVEGITFAQQVLDFFNKQGGIAVSPWGDVLLDMAGIQSDKSHGIGRTRRRLSRLSKMYWRKAGSFFLWIITIREEKGR